METGFFVFLQSCADRKGTYSLSKPGHHIVGHGSYFARVVVPLHAVKKTILQIIFGANTPGHRAIRNRNGAFFGVIDLPNAVPESRRDTLRSLLRRRVSAALDKEFAARASARPDLTRILHFFVLNPGWQT